MEFSKKEMLVAYLEGMLAGSTLTLIVVLLLTH